MSRANQLSQSISVPAWAYLDVVAQDRFNSTLARQAASLPESTAISPQTSISSTPPTSSSVISEAPAAPKFNNTPAIVGGVFGVVVGFGLIVYIITRLLKRSSNKTKRVGSSAEYTKVMPAESPMPVDSGPEAVGFQGRTASPLRNDLYESHSFQATPWTPPVGHTPVSSGTTHSSAYTYATSSGNEK
ncbi:hypothetical protein CPB86DRAFT_797870 [Serendipita vermifera]|nr:hypothetical protein CPB86DRAFT_797870 [Serendipita vermifera]